MEMSVSGPRTREGPDSVEARVVAAVRAALGTQTQRQAWPDVAAAYLDDLATRAGASHVRKSGAQIRAVLAACPGVTVGEVFAHRAERLRLGVSRRTAEMEIAALRACIRWAMRAGLADADPLHGLRPLAIRQGDRRRRPRAFEPGELTALLTAARRRWGVPQDLTWDFLAATGVRWGEAVQLVRGNLDGDRLEIPATAAKARRARTVLVPDHVARRLRAIDGPLLRSPCGKPWRDVGHRGAHLLFRRTLKAARLSPVDTEGRLLTIHSLRRTAATSWVKEGVPMFAVSRLLGHASVEFTERWYLDVRSDDALKALRDVRKKAAGAAASAAEPSSETVDRQG